MVMRSVALAERRADARILEQEIKDHRADCASCGTAKCALYRHLVSELKQVRHEIAHWFDPPADAETLF